MATYFYIEADTKESFIEELLKHDCIYESDIDEIAPNHIMVYCDLADEFEEFALDVHGNSKAKKIIRVTFDSEGY